MHIFQSLPNEKNGRNFSHFVVVGGGGSQVNSLQISRKLQQKYGKSTTVYNYLQRFGFRGSPELVVFGQDCEPPFLWYLPVSVHSLDAAFSSTRVFIKKAQIILD